ncbi:uncharacterized protein LOC116339322 [Contarinia nasturtii]|uniref:uncharacterized protein LOC116339322 n=1 Tax=Contarinia nasturtii TaxID=265458 RepID=UPI0012D377DA|nr:uncharacterized protein LOC116339322 [Contarinia nasturtii]
MELENEMGNLCLVDEIDERFVSKVKKVVETIRETHAVLSEIKINFESRNTTPKNASKKKLSPEIINSMNHLSDSNSTSESSLDADSDKRKKPKRGFNRTIFEFKSALLDLRREANKMMLDSKGDDLIKYFEEFNEIRLDVLSRLKEESDKLSTFIKRHNGEKEEKKMADLDKIIDAAAAQL